DDREVREVALAVLEGAGYRVLEAATGDDAHRLLIAHQDLRVDVLFTDVVMQGRLDGDVLAATARSIRSAMLETFIPTFSLHTLGSRWIGLSRALGVDWRRCPPPSDSPSRPAG